MNLFRLKDDNSTNPKFNEHALLLIPLVFACFALFPSVQASPDPAPPPPSNTRDGQGAMAHITTGINNSAFGTNALNKLTTGNNNAAQGNSALFSLIDGNTNTAVGVLALRLNVRGSRNTAVGYEALYNNMSNGNTAVGYKALFSNFFGFREDAINTAVGYEALLNNADGSFNTAFGHQALRSNIGNLGGDGHGNTAVGSRALLFTTGNNNIGLGVNAGLNLTTGSNNIDIGNAGANTSNAIHIGSGQTRAFIAGIRGRTTGNNNAVPVVIDSAGQLGTLSSSRRFKSEIKVMDNASEAILALKPVTFHYKSDSKGTPQFGLIAEEVAAVNPDLVVRDENGEIYSVRYEAVNAMLLNEFLKEHRTVQEQQKEIDALKVELKEQRALIQKVSDKLDLSRPAPQMVLNSQ